MTNAHGLLFEQTTSLNDALINAGYRVTGEGEVINSVGMILGYSRSKREFIRYLEEQGVDLTVNSDQLLPDDAFINIINRTIYIILSKRNFRASPVRWTKNFRPVCIKSGSIPSSPGRLGMI